jgi:hypothetical protein
MKRAFGLISIIFILVSFIPAHSALGCKFLDAQFRRCRSCCCPTDCCTMPDCCEVVCGPVSAAKAEQGSPKPNAQEPVATPLTEKPEARIAPAPQSPAPTPMEMPVPPKKPAEVQKAAPVVPPAAPAETPAKPQRKKPATSPAKPAKPEADKEPIEIPGISPDDSEEAKPESGHFELPDVKAKEKAKKSVDKPAAKPENKPKKEQAEDPFGQTAPTSSRSWTDITGKHQIEARFVNVMGNTVHLQNAEGRYLRVSLDKLSVADQQLILDIETLARN